jgi:hypothetical protein
MSILGSITQLIDQKYLDIGYTLQFSEHFLELYRNGKIEKVFHNHGTTIYTINEYIKEREESFKI